jgi:ABC-type branched-subunit amino acid transport system ATPase component
VLSQGAALVSGTPAEVRSNPAVLDAYLGGEDDASAQQELAAARPHVRDTRDVRLGSQPAPAAPEPAAPEPAAPEPAGRGTDDEADGPAPLLRIRDVTAGYGGGDILKQVSLDVPRGSITCVVGPNGAGKSTLLATISGLLRPGQGEIEFDGAPISGLTPRAILGRGLAQIPQAHSLFGEMTVRENVEMGAFTINDDALVAERLHAVEELYPIVRDRAGEKAGSLSGGQQRLVEFARCLMLDPELIMLDEPSMGLDPQTRGMVFAMVQEMNRRGKTILLVEQNARAGLRLSSHGVVLENGRVRLTGSGTDVLEHPEIGALYLGGAVSQVTAGD